MQLNTDAVTAPLLSGAKGSCLGAAKALAESFDDQVELLVEGGRSAERAGDTEKARPVQRGARPRASRGRQVKELRASLVAVLDAGEALSAHVRALEALKGRYTCTAGVATDFKARLSGRRQVWREPSPRRSLRPAAQALLQPRGAAPAAEAQEREKYLKAFDQAVWARRSRPHRCSPVSAEPSPLLVATRT